MWQKSSFNKEQSQQADCMHCGTTAGTQRSLFFFASAHFFPARSLFPQDIYNLLFPVQCVCASKEVSLRYLHPLPANKFQAFKRAPLIQHQSSATAFDQQKVEERYLQRKGNESE